MIALIRNQSAAGNLVAYTVAGAAWVIWIIGTRWYRKGQQ